MAMSYLPSSVFSSSFFDMLAVLLYKYSSVVGKLLQRGQFEVKFFSSTLRMFISRLMLCFRMGSFGVAGRGKYAGCRTKVFLFNSLKGVGEGCVDDFLLALSSVLITALPVLNSYSISSLT
jgi:hypothetical protein